MDEDSTPGLSTVIADFIGRYVRHDAEGRLRPLAEYLTRYPGFEEAIAREFAELEARRLTREAHRVEGEGGRTLAHYRIIRSIGRGGQGEVYLAEDTRLKRQVALKVVRGWQQERILRFRREAEAASRLHDPGICGVFDVGEAEGLHYIAMQYVEGVSLADALAGARKDEGEIADAIGIVERVARALHAAHEAGLVHRDVKPRNILVNEEGRPVLLDFGLVLDETSDTRDLTVTGQMTGTPAYLAPEQVAAKRIPIDRRADVYALGVTLYECLTLRHPFEAPTREQLYHKILVAAPPDPRRFNSAVTRDVKAVLETALEKDRDRRYQSALEFAEDLRRIREFEPVRARPAGPALKLRRWARRNRALAAALTGIFLILVGGLGVSLHLLAESDRERRRAEINFQMAMDAVEQMLTEVGLSEESLASLPDLDESRRRLLERALAFYRRFLERRHDDPRVRREAALAHHRVAHFLFLLGKLHKANDENTIAIARCRDLIRERPGDAGVCQDLIRFSREQASILAASGRNREAIEVLHRSLAMGRALLDRVPDRLEVVGLLAECQTELGELLTLTGDVEGAEKTLREAMERLDKLIAANPEAPSPRCVLAIAFRKYSHAIRHTRPDRELAPLEKSLSLLEALVQRHPRVSSYVLEHAVTLQSLGVFEITRNLRKADALLVNAIRSLERLRTRHPEQWAIRLQLAGGRLYRAQILFDEGRQEESEALLKKAIELTDGLGAGLAGSPTRARRLIDIYRLLAQCLHSSHRSEEARHYDEKSLALAKANLLGPDDLPMLWTLANMYASSGYRLSEEGELEKAEERLLEAIAIQEKLTATRPRWVGINDNLAMALNKLGGVYYRQDRMDEAEPLFARSLAMRRELARLFPDSAYAQSRLGATLHNVAAQYLRRREMEKVRDMLEEAIAAQLTAFRIAPELRVTRLFLREHIRCHGGVLLELGDYRGAVVDAETLARHLPESPFARFSAALLLAGAAALTDEGDQQSERYAERAVLQLEKAVAHGFKDLDTVRNHAWFRRLRDREDLRRVLKPLVEKE